MVSSAKNRTVLLETSSGKSFMLMRNSKGTRTKPCGTSESTGKEEDDFPSRTTFCDLPERKEPIQPKVFPLTPCYVNL